METRERELVDACRIPASAGIPAMAALVPLLIEKPSLSPDEAAHALGCGVDDLDEVLARLSFRVERADDGRILGAGVTSVPTSHRFEVQGRERYVWCALDTLLFPAIAGVDARIESRCAVTGDAIRFVATPTGVETVTPERAHVVLVPPALCCDDLRASFCDEVVFTRDAETGAAWAARRQNAWAMPLADAACLARHMAAALR